MNGGWAIVWVGLCLAYGAVGFAWGYFIARDRWQRRMLHALREMTGVLRAANELIKAADREIRRADESGEWWKQLGRAP